MTDPAKASSTEAPVDLAPRLRPEALAFLLERRSTPAKTLTAPGPDEATLGLILTAAARTPDHGKLVPWRFLIIREAAQAALAEAAAARATELGRDAADVEKARRAFLDGALIVAVVASPKPHDKIPEIEQRMSAAAVCLSLLNAALASGFGANWLSGWISHDETFRRSALKLAETETVAGFIHIGAPRVAPAERPRPKIDALATELTAETIRAG